ncbi:MAG: adenosylcobinamide-GDP ribazoletransferase, partial [Methanomassiliicoccaceae archaeon]|nr:adenosylcobinamide-GDP ribazoletransferase [Methanomassiliicoccaceae archaeon]
VDDEEIKAMDKNMFIIPFVGLIIGIVASIIGLVFDGLRAGAMVSIAVLASVYIMSKFLHFDGLADFGDGMIAGGDREGRIRALKDTRIGAGGLGVVLVVVLATIAAYNGIWTAFMLAAVVVIAEVFVKNAMVAAAAFGEPGNGMASEQVRNTNTSTLLLSTILSAGLAFAGYLIMGLIVSIVNTNGMWSTVPLVSAVILIAGAAVSSIFVGWLIAYLSNKKFGFVNGDVLGATNEISRVLILFVALLIVQFYTIPEWPGWIMGFF